MSASRLNSLYSEHGQSPWLDNLRRGYITSGQLEELRDRGVRGLTSNPSIFRVASTAENRLKYNHMNRKSNF